MPNLEYRVPTFWKVLECPGNEKNVQELCEIAWKMLEINEFLEI